jgi:hypothetical protein
MREIQLSWTALKALKTAKNLSFNYDENAAGTVIEVFLGDTDILWYSKLTAGADITDFNNNYKTDANKRTPNQVMIGNDSTEVDIINDGTYDRLAVNAVTSLSPVFADRVIYKIAPFLNGASRNLNVNGSGTPVEFTFTPASGETWYLEALNILVRASSTPDPDEFGNVGSRLTNGMQILVKSNGTEYEIANLQDNTDISTWFNNPGMSMGMGGWLNSEDSFFGTMIFNVPLLLANSTGDYVKIKVRDNLSGVNHLFASYKVWRTI